MSDPIAAVRNQFSIFIVDPDEMKARVLGEIATGFGFAPARAFLTVATAIEAARAELPHLVLFDYDGLESETESALAALAELSSEILVLLMIRADQEERSLEFVSRKLAYDAVTWPLVSSLALSLAMDRAAQRLYYQFESEQIREAMANAAAAASTEAPAPPAEPEPESKEPIEYAVSSEPTPPGPEDATVMIPRLDLQNLIPPSPSTLPPSVTAPPSLTVVPPTEEPNVVVAPVDPAPIVAASLGRINEFIARIAETKDLDEALEIFLEAMADDVGSPILYMKYLPSHASLLVSNAARVPIDRFRGIGIDLRKEGAAKAHELLKSPTEIASLKELIHDVFQKDHFIAIPHFNGSDAFCVCIVLGEIDTDVATSRALALWGIFELAWKRNATIKEKHALDILDAVTGLLNRRHFAQRLDEEISRARRIHLPLALITIDLDGFHVLNETIGYQQSDSVLKALAQIIRKTARSSDIVARTGPDEISCLLPHTPGMGAALKAERMRRIIESTKFPLLESMSITVSCGVSEFPSLVGDADALVRSADEALEQVRAAGGNKVCLAAAAPGHAPEFIPREMPKGGGPS